jgi:hypothetical protein
MAPLLLHQPPLRPHYRHISGLLPPSIRIRGPDALSATEEQAERVGSVRISLVLALLGMPPPSSAMGWYNLRVGQRSHYRTLHHFRVVRHRVHRGGDTTRRSRHYTAKYNGPPDTLGVHSFRLLPRRILHGDHVQAIKGTTAIQSGIDNLPSILASVVFSLVAGGLVTVVGYYTWACILSAVLTTVVCPYRAARPSNKWHLLTFTGCWSHYNLQS